MDKETKPGYSTPEIVDEWKFQWHGNIYYSHGTNHSKGELKTWDVLQNKNITMAEYLLLMSVFDTIPLEWKTILKQHLQTAHADTHDSKDVVLPTSSRVQYWDLVKKIETIPTS